MNNTGVVLFDLDGTLADTNEIILRAFADTLEHETGRVWHREELLPHWGMRLRDQLQRLHPAIDLERAVPWYRWRYAVYHDALLAAFPGVHALLTQLQADGRRLGVVTSKKREICRLTLEGLGMHGYFAVVVAEEDTVRHKPAPDPLLHALAQLDTPATTGVYVGDNPDDVIAARAAGLRAVVVGWTLRPRSAFTMDACPDAFIETPASLLDWLNVFRTE